MSQANQRAYLQALDIPVWIRKELVDIEPGFDVPGLRLGPGSSLVLLLCSSADEPARRIAVDIARCLKSEPVWAWPDSDMENPDLAEVVAEQLFTTVLIFGEALAASLFNSKMPETLGSARIIQSLSLQDLERSPTAKRDLWNLIKSNHLAAIPGKQTG